MKSIKTLWWLFKTNFMISAFTFGGGYTAVMMIRQQFVDKKQMMSEEKLMELSAIAQSSPGAIAVNLAALSGYHTAQSAGLLVSAVASVLPALLLLSVIGGCYEMFLSIHWIQAALQGMQAVVAAMIVQIAQEMAWVIKKQRQAGMMFILVFSFLLSLVLNISVAFILLLAALLGVYQALKEKRGKAHA